MLLRHTRCVFSRCRCNGHSLLLSSYFYRIGRIKNPSGSACGHLFSHSALYSYGLFASLALWQFDVSLRPLSQILLSFPTSGAPWSSAINPSLGKGRVTTTTAKLKLQTHYYVTKRVSKFRRSQSCKQNYVTICNLLSQDFNSIYIHGTPLHKKINTGILK